MLHGHGLRSMKTSRNGSRHCPPCTASTACPCCCPWPGTCASATPARGGTGVERAPLLPNRPTVRSRAPRCAWPGARREARWLDGELDNALDAATDILQRFTRWRRHRRADSHWLLAWIAVDRGDHDASDPAFAAAAAAAERAPTRSASSWPGRPWRAGPATRPQHRGGALGRQFNSDSAQAHPALATWINDFLALAAAKRAATSAPPRLLHPLLRNRARNGPAARRHHRRHNIGEDFTLLGDHIQRSNGCRRAGAGAPHRGRAAWAPA